MFPFFYKYAEQFCQQVGSREKQNPFVFLNIYFPSCLLDSNSYLTCLGEDDDSIRVVVVDNLNAWGTATCRFVILFSLSPPPSSSSQPETLLLPHGAHFCKPTSS